MRKGLERVRKGTGKKRRKNSKIAKEWKWKGTIRKERKRKRG